jgi:uncharacterized membrane protein required for colicin V production
MGDLIGYQNLFDLLVLLLCAAAFIMGYIQGAIRRVIGIASIVLALVLASQLNGPVGGFLANNWAQFPASYTRMIALGGTFAVLVVAFAIVTQGYYERAAIVPDHPKVDSLLGGLLGVVEALVIIGAVVLILDSYFRLPDATEFNAELPIVRSLFHAIDVSEVARLYRENFIPAFLVLLGALFSPEVRAMFPG